MRLMKYEFMAMGRVFLPLYGALIIISLVNMTLGLVGLEVPERIGIVISVLLMIGIAVVTLILIIQRFWTNLLSNEGYLMMTLPVSTDKIILSNLIVASVWYVVSTGVVTVAILIMAAPAIFLFPLVMDRYISIPTVSPYEIIQFLTFFAQLFILSALSLFAGTLLLYACMALGMIANKYRWLVAVAAYIVITTILQIIVAIATAVGIVAGIAGAFDGLLRNFSAFAQVQLVMLLAILIIAVLCAAFYFITRYMLKNRLNLQ
jgi:hypothetical protein